MRQLSEEARTTFKGKYLQMYGVQLNDEQANEKGLELLRFMQVIYKPIPKEEAYGNGSSK